MKRSFPLVCFCVLVTALFAVSAEAAGTINVTFKYRDITGVETALPNAYLYLQPGSVEPPREKFFVNAPYIVGPSNAYGNISAIVPDGVYFARVTARSMLDNRPYGPPVAGDYTWSQASTILVTAGSVVNLGTKYADPFGSAPIVISGTVTDYYGSPLSGYYVRAQTEMCIEANGYEYRASNRCGPEKHPAQPTDENGRYTLYLRAPGTFYLYTSTCIGDRHKQYSGNPCVGSFGGEVSVNARDRKTVNFVAR